MTGSDRRLNILFLLNTGAWSLAWALAGHHEAALFMAPALLLALPLAFGRYVGERQLERLRARLELSPPRRRPFRERSPLPRLVRAVLPRGGALIAADLAKRPPPYSPQHA